MENYHHNINYFNILSKFSTWQIPITSCQIFLESEVLK